MKKQAFTLIELLVVMVIIAILATMGVANFSNSADKAYQGKSYALQGQIGSLISADCVLNNYSCLPNLVPNWAFSEGDTGEWDVSSTAFTIDKYRLTHKGDPAVSAPRYISVPLNETLSVDKVYRVDVVGRDVLQNGANMYGAGFIGFSIIGSGIGSHVRIPDEINTHMCDVFRPAANNAPIRLFVSGRADAVFDEVSIREVVGYSDVLNNDDCALEKGGVVSAD